MTGKYIPIIMCDYTFRLRCLQILQILLSLSFLYIVFIYYNITFIKYQDIIKANHLLFYLLSQRYRQKNHRIKSTTLYLT